MEENQAANEAKADEADADGIQADRVPPAGTQEGEPCEGERPAAASNELSPAEQLIIESYKVTMAGLADYYGEAFEFVLHNLTDVDHSIIKILNGFHSGRHEGAPTTDLGLSFLEQLRKDGGLNATPYSSYTARSKFGKPVRSSTIVIFGENHRAIGLLCINLYLDSPIQSILQNFSVNSHADYVSENFSADSDELIDRALEGALADVDAAGVPASHRNKEIVFQLYHQGIFRLKNAVHKVAQNLGISRSTVYLHIRSMEERE